MKTEIQPHPTPFPWGQRTFVMGIINVTPDSFSGDGLGANVDAAVEQGLSFEALSADMLDVGGQSTRPGHTPVSEQEELTRVIPVVKSLASRSNLPISIDTFYARVAAEALSAGASIVNDQWALRRDPEMAPLAAGAGVPVVLMHNQAARSTTTSSPISGPALPLASTTPCKPVYAPRTS